MHTAWPRSSRRDVENEVADTAHSQAGAFEPYAEAACRGVQAVATRGTAALDSFKRCLRVAP